MFAGEGEDGDLHCPCFFQGFCAGRCGAAGGENVVDEKDALPGHGAIDRKRAFQIA